MWWMHGDVLFWAPGPQAAGPEIGELPYSIFVGVSEL